MSIVRWLAQFLKVRFVWLHMGNWKFFSCQMSKYEGRRIIVTLTKQLPISEILLRSTTTQLYKWTKIWNLKKKVQFRKLFTVCFKSLIFFYRAVSSPSKKYILLSYYFFVFLVLCDMHQPIYCELGVKFCFFLFFLFLSP